MCITKRLFLLAAAVLAAAAPLTPERAAAQTRPNIVVMSEDADEDTVPRGNRIFNRVIHELAEVMNVHGYNVYDETAVAMGFTQPGRVRRRDTEIIDVARAVQTPPLDVIAVFQIYASATKSTVSDIVRPNIRIPGRLLNVRTGQQIAAFEVAGLELAPLPQGCDRECLLERVGGEAKLVANELAQALTQKLSGFILPARGANAVGGPAPLSGGVTALVPSGGDGQGCVNLPTAFVIRLNGFSTSEVEAIEEYLRAFGCYLHHRPIRSTASQAEYWYETRADSARLNRNMQLMLEHMSTVGQVSFAGNIFNITKLATR
jgi:hypothetical protein